MVPMRMSENKVVLVPVFIDQFVAKPPYAGSGVNDDNVVIFCSDF